MQLIQGRITGAFVNLNLDMSKIETHPYADLDVCESEVREKILENTECGIPVTYNIDGFSASASWFGVNVMLSVRKASRQRRRSLANMGGYIYFFEFGGGLNNSANP